MDTLENLRRKMESATELKSVVKTMKAMAASNIVQYQQAVIALKDYYNNVQLGIVAYFGQEKNHVVKEERTGNNDKSICAIVFGSDQGLVGQFNDKLSSFAVEYLNTIKGKKQVWSVGERIHSRLSDAGLLSEKLFAVPNSVSAITALVGRILIDIEKCNEQKTANEFYIFYNRPTIGAGYEPTYIRLLPLDNQWKKKLDVNKWPTNKTPQVVGSIKPTLAALIGEYIFVSIYKACAESLASENASRLEAMQRAEKNINELLEEQNNKYHRLRQSAIDEELFDVVAGFEAMRNEENKNKSIT
jgi:F-type H+-transporting ATPase subunit gamma